MTGHGYGGILEDIMFEISKVHEGQHILTKYDRNNFARISIKDGHIQHFQGKLLWEETD